MKGVVFVAYGDYHLVGEIACRIETLQKYIEFHVGGCKDDRTDAEFLFELFCFQVVEPLPHFNQCL